MVTEVELSEDRMVALRDLSAERNKPIADLIVEGVDRILHESERATRAQRLIASIGKYSSGLTDVSEDHDRYLTDDVAR